MKKSIITLFLFYTSLLAQHPLPEEFLSFAVLINLSNSGAASGFFYNDSTNTYLVTAKHVFFKGPNNQLISNSADLISYPRDPFSTQYNILRCNLKLLLDSNLVRYHKIFDVAVAQIGRQEYRDSTSFIVYNSAITKPNPKLSRINEFYHIFIEGSEKASVGTEVHLFGFPVSIGIKELPQLDPYQPLLRRGIIAGKNKKLNTIIIDCPSYKGNSGGPVIASIVKGDTTKFRLIGIVSEFVPFEEKWINDKYGYANVEYTNSDYSIVAPVNIMLELIKEFK